MRRVLVLGGSGDIGSAIAERFAADGEQVLATGSAQLDLSRPDEVPAALDRLGSEFDVLVHAAGFNVPKPFEQLAQTDIDQTMTINVMGFLAVTRALLPYWQARQSGRIVVLSSLYGFQGRRGRLAYAMAKHALLGAVRTLAIEFAPHGVLINAVSPGYIATKLTYRNNPPEVLQRLLDGIPLGRLGSPQDIAEVVQFLCSERNRYLTGQDIVVDGGATAGIVDHA